MIRHLLKSIFKNIYEIYLLLIVCGRITRNERLQALTMIKQTAGNAMLFLQHISRNDFYARRNYIG